jgi:hypothetical protein
VWIFGIYERETKKILFFEVPSRDAFSLLNKIYKHVAAYSIIYSDCWASYARIRRLDKNFEHLTVNHDLRGPKNWRAHKRNRIELVFW